MEREYTTCQITKPHSDFVKATNFKYGIGYTCYECKRKFQNEKIICGVCCKEVQKWYMTKHSSLQWHTELEKFINKILQENDKLHSQLYKISEC